MPLAALRSPKRPFCQAISPLTAVTPSACAILASRSGAEIAGQRIGLSGAGHGDADHQRDGRQDDE